MVKKKAFKVALSKTARRKVLHRVDLGVKNNAEENAPFRILFYSHKNKLLEV